jgi:hypothetical protein
MGFKLRSQEDPVKASKTTVPADASTAANRVALMTAANNISSKQVPKKYTPSFQQSQSKVQLDSYGGGDIGVHAGKKFSFDAGVNINPRVEGVRASLGYKDKARVGFEKTKFGANVSADASLGNFNFNASQESGDLGYKSMGVNFNRGSFSGGADYTLDNQGDRAISANASFRKNGKSVYANANAYNDKLSGSLGGSLRRGRTTLNAKADLSPGRRTSIGGGITYRF